MRREKPIMNLLMISNAFSFPWIGTHLVKVPFLFSFLVVLAMWVCVRAYFSLSISLSLSLLLRFRHYTAISNFHTNRNPRIDWVNRFLAVATKCIYFTVFYNIRMPYNEHFAQSSEKVLCSCGRIRERKRNKSRTNEQKASIYIYECVCAIGLRAAIVFMQCILHEQIVKWNGSQTYISQRYLSYSWAHAISRFYFLFCFWCFVLASPFSLLDARSAPHLHCLQRFHSIHQVPTIHFYKLQSLPYNHWSLGVLQKEKHTQTTTTNEIKKMNAFRIMEQKCKQIGTT